MIEILLTYKTHSHTIFAHPSNLDTIIKYFLTNTPKNLISLGY